MRVNQPLSLTIPDPNNPSNPSGVTFGAPATGVKTGSPGDIDKVITWGISFLLYGLILLALGYILYGGIMWITSQGDKEKINSARKMITYAIGGMVLAILAIAIVITIGRMIDPGLELLNFTF